MKALRKGKVYLDLESKEDVAKQGLFFAHNAGKLICSDEIQFKPYVL